MATNFPGSLDAFTNPSSSDTLDNPPHDQQHADVNDAVEALQAKVGVDGSAVTDSLDYKVENFTNKLGSGSAVRTFGTFAGGEVLQAAELNTVLPACMLPSTSVTLTTGTPTYVPFATESYDPLGWHSTTSNTSRITPTIAGWYLCNAYVNNINGAGTNMRGFIGIERSRAETVSRFDINNYAPDDFGTTGFVYLDGSTDYVEVVVAQYSGGNRTPTVKLSVVLVAR